MHALLQSLIEKLRMLENKLDLVEYHPHYDGSPCVIKIKCFISTKEKKKLTADLNAQLQKD